MRPLRPQRSAALRRSGPSARPPASAVRAVRRLAQCSHQSPDRRSAPERQRDVLPRTNVATLAPASLRLCSRGLRCCEPHGLPRAWATRALLRAPPPPAVHSPSPWTPRRWGNASPCSRAAWSSAAGPAPWPGASSRPRGPAPGAPIGKPSWATDRAAYPPIGPCLCWPPAACTPAGCVRRVKRWAGIPSYGSLAKATSGWPPPSPCGR
jgi:hypothetical protein